jgi:hypothetical protein
MERHYTYRWFTIAVLFLGVGGAFALSIGLSRTPFGYQYLPSEFLFQAIVGHVILAIVFWLLSFTVVLWSIYFKGREFAWSYLLPIAGAICVTFAVFTEGRSAVANNYIPTIDHPVFFIGIGLFFTGFAINALTYLRDALGSLKSDDLLKSSFAFSVPIAVVMVVALLVSLIFFAGAGERDLLFFERLFWIPGHIQQVLSGVLLISVWYALKRAMGLEIGSTSGYLKFFNWMLVVSALALFAIPFFLDPIAREAKIVSEIVYAVGLGIPIFAHGINILRGLKRRGNVLFISLVLSMTIYFFGIAIAYSGFGNDLRVPAHYHGAVTGLTLAMMGLSHSYLKGVRIKGFIKRLADIQPAVYGAGMLLVISGLMVSGMFGAPRKTYGVSFATEPVVLLALTVMGIGTLLAVAGGVIFVVYSGASLIKVVEDNGSY